MRTLRLLAACSALALACAGASRDPAAEMAELLLAAQRAGNPLPRPTLRHPDLDPQAAYAIQGKLVEARRARDEIAGFKAALTSEAAQQRMGSAQPVLGVLFASGRRAPDSAVQIRQLRSPLLETELGFYLSRAVLEPLRDLGELRARVARRVLVIEIPELGFEPAEGVRLADLIAANAGSALFIVGGEIAAGCGDPNEIAVRLSRGAEQVSRGAGSDALGDQWEALLWAVNTAVGLGYRVEPDHLIITGALGAATPAGQGRYQAVYEGCGRIGFELR